MRTPYFKLHSTFFPMNCFFDEVEDNITVMREKFLPFPHISSFLRMCRQPFLCEIDPMPNVQAISNIQNPINPRLWECHAFFKSSLWNCILYSEALLMFLFRSSVIAYIAVLKIPQHRCYYSIGSAPLQF